jgi:hypothetical protein
VLYLRRYPEWQGSYMNAARDLTPLPDLLHPFYARVPEAVQAAMDELGARASRHSRPASYHGHPEASQGYQIRIFPDLACK